MEVTFEGVGAKVIAIVIACVAMLLVYAAGRHHNKENTGFKGYFFTSIIVLVGGVLVGGMLSTALSEYCHEGLTQAEQYQYRQCQEANSLLLREYVLASWVALALAALTGLTYGQETRANDNEVT
jgi:hypothetical protein